MRYPIIFLILAGLFMIMPTEKAKKDEKRSAAAIAQIMSEGEQKAMKQWLDTELADLREMSPMHQLLVISTIIILIINAAVIVAYLINSVASILGIGISIALFAPLALVALLWSKPRKSILRKLEKHAEFGPFTRKMSTRMWKRRFRRAAREHGFASQYSY
jgi:Flp pilus assembly protein TadB